MAQTHTPGPWNLISDPYRDGTPYFRIKAGDPWNRDLATMGFTASIIMRESDARLICAAPEMLAALKAFVSAENVLRATASGLDADTDITAQAYELAVAAISK